MGALAQGQFWTPRPYHRAWGQQLPVPGKKPAAGKVWELVTPPAYLTRLVTMAITFTASAQVATRTPGVELLDQTGATYYLGFSGTSIVAGTATVITVAPDVSCATPPAGFPQVLTLPDVLLPPEWVIKGFMNNIQTEDQFGEPHILTEQYEPNPDHPIAEVEHTARAIQLLNTAVDLASA